jgi:hypothetical protein
VGASEFQVIGRTFTSEHHPIEAVMILKLVQDDQAQSVSVEMNNRIQVVGGSSDTERWNIGHNSMKARTALSVHVG